MFELFVLLIEEYPAFAAIDEAAAARTFKLATFWINGLAAIVPAAVKEIVVFPPAKPLMISAGWNVSPAVVPVAAKPLTVTLAEVTLMSSGLVVSVKVLVKSKWLI